MLIHASGQRHRRQDRRAASLGPQEHPQRRLPIPRPRRPPRKGPAGPGERSPVMSGSSQPPTAEGHAQGQPATQPAVPAGENRRKSRGSSTGRAGLVTEDLFGSQWPVTQHPGKTPVPQFASQLGRRDGQDGALRVGQAVPGHRRRSPPAHGAAAASPHEQHIRRMAGQADQHPPGGAPLHVRLHHRVVGDLPPHRNKRILEPLAGQLAGFLPQRPRRLDSLGPLTPGRFPGHDRHQHRMMRTGQELSIAKRPQTAR